MAKSMVILSLVSTVIYTALCQDISLEQSVYVVSEDITTRNLALLVCVEGTNLDDQEHNIRIMTEDLSATDGQDYMGVDEQLVLFGPGDDNQCVCVEIIEDGQKEEDEIFGIRISGSPIISIDSANATIRDNDGTSFVFTGDTPMVDSNVVVFELQFEGGVTSATCGVTTQEAIDCSNGRAEFTLPSTRVRNFQPVITTSGVQGQSEPVADPNRRFRIGSTRRCSAHLINEGIVYNPVTGDTTFEWAWSGPGAVGRYICQLDDQASQLCESKFVVPDLTNGEHTFVIRTKDGECDARFRRFLKFDIPPN